MSDLRTLERLRKENARLRKLFDLAVDLEVDTFQGPGVEIPPGESREFWIHHGRQLQIDEKQETSGG